MILPRPLRLLVSALLLPHVVGRPARRHYDTHNYYALEHIPGAFQGATLEEVSMALGVEVVEQAGELEDVWLVRVPKSSANLGTRADSFDPAISKLKLLQEHSKNSLAARSEDGIYAGRIVSSVRLLELQIPAQLVKRAPLPVSRLSKDVARRLGLEDPLFTEQWHLINDEYPEHSMNTTPVWDMGLTGKGVLTSFLDDGLDFESDDLKDAFDAENSHDFNDHVDLPRPVSEWDSHGTRCAGQVVAQRNGVCGVGIAYDAKAAGVRILGGPITTVDEATALNYGHKNVSIYSCSWGPRDDGMTMEGPNYLVRKAMVTGINGGRNGKGSIFVFASGNGAGNEDQCNYDGYTNSIYSVTVSAIDWKGKRPAYSEACAANMIAAYTSGGDRFIVTTDVGKDKCSRYHGGTSAAAPNVVGVFALALQARPDLTWRDIQHLCVETARKVNPDDPDWERTASGRLYSYKYGYGALDAYAYVKAAQTWKLVKPQAWIHTETVQINGGKLHSLGHHKYDYEGGDPIGPNGIEHKTTITKEMMLENNLESLEHIDVRVWINHSRRGDVKIEIVSPNGIRSVLAAGRKNDESTSGFPGWRLNTIKHWGENPIGDWILKVTDMNDPNHNGTFLGWNMALWGSAIDAAKAKKFVEPVVDNALPPSDAPSRPVINDPAATSATQHAKPTDHLPPDHGKATGENTLPAFPSSTSNPNPQQDDKDPESGSAGSWFGLASNNGWYFGGLGAGIMCIISLSVYFWKRRAARQRLAAYTSLAADDIQMESVGEDDLVAPGGGPGSTRRTVFEEPSSENIPAHLSVDPPPIKGLGFHSGFLDDDEPSPGLSPRYRDHPERTSHDSLRTSMEGRSPNPTGHGEHLT
ncbi:hypothetical protein GALMADRAFT_283420 [Galerina marginata CBS 339.88]|uniref:P/Homo B domain-containing protein n=1 Tax=Galerina marginata (strain CBS 339.88) TaxID=685588 RepID=A0A067SIW0_GALM3|nr:hypothetical protein GALMADRAFT_283420 [Galerina marginata CBS 339.88]